MSGLPRARSTNVKEPENKAPKYPESEKAENPEARNKKCGKKVVASVLRQKSMNASFSSDVSTDSSSSSSSGRLAAARRRRDVVEEGKKQRGGSGGGGAAGGQRECAAVGVEMAVEEAIGCGNRGDCLEIKKRCAWVTPTSDVCYVTFHDEEWGVPVHDDKQLFELLSLSGALAELAWPVILNKRHLFREFFLDFDPVAVSKLKDKKLLIPGSPATSLLSELKLRSIIENAHQMRKVIDEFGSFDKYIWSFVNHKPIINQFRYSRQVPAKTPKAELISKDLVKRGFRSVGPTVIYSFMQVAGLTNDHLVSCFRFQNCTTKMGVGEVYPRLKVKTEQKEPDDETDGGLPYALGDHISAKQLFKVLGDGS